MALRNPMSGRMLGSDRATWLRAQGPYLAGTAQLEESRKYQDTAVAQANQRLGIMQGDLDAANAALAENIRQNKITEGMTREQIDEARKQARTANVLGAAGLGVGAIGATAPIWGPALGLGSGAAAAGGAGATGATFAPSLSGATEAITGVTPMATTGMGTLGTIGAGATGAAALAGAAYGQHELGKQVVQVGEGTKAASIGGKIGATFPMIPGLSTVGRAIGGQVSEWLGRGRTTKDKQVGLRVQNRQSYRQWNDLLAKNLVPEGSKYRDILMAIGNAARRTDYKTGAGSPFPGAKTPDRLALNLAYMPKPNEVISILERIEQGEDPKSIQSPAGDVVNTIQWMIRQGGGEGIAGPGGMDVYGQPNAAGPASTMTPAETMAVVNSRLDSPLSPSQRNIENQFQTTSGTIDFFTGQAMP